MASHPETHAIQQLQAELHNIQNVTVSVGKSHKPHNTVESSDDVINRLLELLRSDWFVSVVGYFINHRANSPYAKIDDEYKIQDLIYCLALTMIPDLQYEDPQKKNSGALTSTRVDFYSAKHQLFLEMKLASSTHTAKKVEAEISEDIVKYGRQRIFSTLIFFVYCNEYAFPNPREFEKGFTGAHNIQGHQFQIYCVVKP